ncbi:MAG: malate dehydrogenase [Myxococcota bacterium]|jgi:malate dehydrogenase
MAKIGLIGFGGIGIEAAKALVQDQNLTCDIVAFDRKQAIEQVPGPQAGAYAEIVDTIGILQTADSIKLTSDMGDLAGCDAIIFTAGLPRRGDQTRSDLIGINVPIVGGLCKELGKVAHGALLIMVTNPLDAMVELALRNTGFPESHVVGQAGVLDTGRFTAQASMATGVPASQINTMVMGGHGPTMVPVYSASTVAYRPLKTVLDADKVEEITQEVRKRGKTIILEQGRSAVFSTAVAAVKMAKAYLLDTREILPACTRLNGEYGYSDTFGGVPTLFSREGVKAVEIPLTESEKAEFDSSMGAVAAILSELDAAS